MYEVKKPSKKDFDDANSFMKKYGGTNFDDISFRPGASYSDPFGLTDRYKTINGKAVWGYPGIHTGTDRGISPRVIQGISNPVFVPFDFPVTSFLDDGGTMYGTVCSFYSEYGFVLKICHMRPENILELDKLKSHESIKAGTLLGPADKYGFSYGIHTHTDVESFLSGQYIETCPMLDAILDIKYGEKAYQELTEEEILTVYSKSEKTKSFTKEQCLKEFEEVKKLRGILFLNNYKYVFKDYGKNKIYTRYGTKPLFDM